MGLFLTVTVETMEKEQFLHLHDKILPSILKHDVSSMDGSPIAEELLEKEQLLHLHDEIRPSILKHDVPSMDGSSIAEELLYIENIAVRYDVDSLVVSHVEHTSAASPNK